MPPPKTVALPDPSPVRKYALLRELPLLAAELNRRGWKRTFEDDWNLHWDWSVPDRHSSADGPCRPNHFVGSRDLHRKDLQAAVLLCTPASGFAGVPGALAPQTFVMPQHRADLLRAAAADPAAVWISKPIDGSLGKGIRIVQPGEDFPNAQGTLVQRYMDRPHLIDGHRYTLRIWVAVLSLDPFVMYICRDGLLKRAGRLFGMDVDSLNDPVVHLTNSIVQQGASTGILPLLCMDDLAQLLGDRYSDVWSSIRTTCAASMLGTRQILLDAAEEAAAAGEADPAARPFEFFGFDIMLDSDLRPWVIEINLNPDMRPVWSKGDLESSIKARVLGDLADLAFPHADAAQYPASCGTLEMLFPSADEEQFKTRWMPTEQDRKAFNACGFAAPAQAERDLLRNARFVDDGVILFSPDRREFLTMNDSAAMIALRNDEGEAVTAETWPLIQNLWRFIAPASVSLSQADHSELWQPAYTRSPGSALFNIAGICVACAVPAVSTQLRKHLPLWDSLAEPADTLHVVAVKERIQVVSRLGVVPCKVGSALGTLMKAARYLLADQPGCIATFSGSALRFGGQGIAICGLPIRGKSTLAAALCMRGGELIADGIVCLDAHCHPRNMKLPLGLQPDALELLKDHLSPEITTPPSDREEGVPAYFYPAMAEGSAAIQAFIFVRLMPGEPTRMTPLGVCEALRRMQQSSLQMSKSPSLADGDAIIETLTRAVRVELVIGSLEDAVQQMLALTAGAIPNPGG